MLTLGDVRIDMHYCRRCGDSFTRNINHVYVCPNSHIVYANASPAATTIISNPAGEVLVVKRGIDPGKGLYHLPGGFCDGAEPLEEAARREIQEEVGVAPSQYGPISFVCSGIDPYEFAGEVLPVMVGIFSVQLHQNVMPESFDDVADSFFCHWQRLIQRSFIFQPFKKASGNSGIL